MFGGVSTTVIIALAANFIVAIAKSVTAGLTGSASLFAEAAHSWADTGNQLFLLIADVRSRREPDAEHPFGHGREAYVWTLFAAIGLFALGALVSIWHGVGQLRNDDPITSFAIAYGVLGVAALFEGASFLQALREVRRGAGRLDRELAEHLLATSDTTLRSVFFEDAAALVGLAIAAAGVTAHHVTGSALPDAIGSILVGVLLAVVALVLIDRNRRFLVGEVVDGDIRGRVLERLLAAPDVERVTFLRVEFVGPRELLVTAAVDVVGDEREHDLAAALERIERHMSARDEVRAVLLTLARADAPSLSA